MLWAGLHTGLSGASQQYLDEPSRWTLITSLFSEEWQILVVDTILSPSRPFVGVGLEPVASQRTFVVIYVGWHQHSHSCPVEIIQLRISYSALSLLFAHSSCLSGFDTCHLVSWLALSLSLSLPLNSIEIESKKEEEKRHTAICALVSHISISLVLILLNCS